MNEDTPIPNADDPEKKTTDIENTTNLELDNTGTNPPGATDTIISETNLPAAGNSVTIPVANTGKTEQINTEGTASSTNTAKTGTDPNVTGGGNNANNSYLASQETPENTSGKAGIVALGIYLLLMIFITVYLLGGLMMAETNKDKINAKLGITPTPTATPTETPTPTATPTPTPTPANTNVTTGNTNGVAGNSNKANAAPGNSNKPTGNSNTPVTSSPTKTPTPIEQNIPEVTIPAEVYVSIPFVMSQTISADSYVFLVVMFSGMLGAVIRAIYSFIDHLGLKNFSFNWSWFYISLPFSGAALSLVIYFVIRGGFYGSSFGKGLVLNLFSFAALGALTGLFTDHAMEKLKQVASLLLADVPPKVENAKEIVEQKEANKGKQT